MRLRYRVRFCVALLLAGIGASTAEALVLFEDNFDSYTNQAAFESSWSLFTANPASPSTSHAVLSQAQAQTAANSLLVPANPTTGGTNNINRSQHNFTDSPSLGVGEKLAFSFDFYDTNAAAAPFRQFSEMRDAAGTSSNQLVAMGLNNNLSSAAEGGNYYMARILLPTGVNNPNGGANTAFFKLNDTGAPLRSTGWHNLKAVISKNAALSIDYSFYVDNILSKQALAFPGAHRQFDSVNIGNGITNAGNAAYYDNVKVEFIPAAVAIDGDYNANGFVDGADYVVWRKNNGLMGGATVSQGDGTLDGNVLDDDYTYWRERFGNPTGGSGSLAAGAVPEPATALLLMVGAAALLVGRARPR